MPQNTNSIASQLEWWKMHFPEKEINIIFIYNLLGWSDSKRRKWRCFLWIGKVSEKLKNKISKFKHKGNTIFICLKGEKWRKLLSSHHRLFLYYKNVFLHILQQNFLQFKEMYTIRDKKKENMGNVGYLKVNWKFYNLLCCKWSVKRK